MDKYRVMLMSRAYDDIDGIYEYIASGLGSPLAAERLVEELEEAVFSLDNFPYRGPFRKTGMYGGHKYRQLLIKNYSIIHRAEEESKRVIVVTVRHVRQI